MTAAAKLLRDLRDIHVAFRSETGAINSRFTLFQHRDGFDLADSQRIVNKPVSVFIRSLRVSLHLHRLPHTSHASCFVPSGGRQNGAHELNTAPRVTGKHCFSSFRRLDAGAYELGSDFESALGRVRVMKRSGVGDQRCVDALCDLFRDANAGRFAEVVDHFTDRRCSRIDPVDVSEQRSRRMVIDVDDELLFEIREPRARNVGTLDHKHGVIRRIDDGSDAYVVCAGELLVSVWNRIAHDDFDVFIKRTQQPVKTERRSEAVAVGADMRGDRETTLCLDQLDYLTKHDSELRLRHLDLIQVWQLAITLLPFLCFPTLARSPEAVDRRVRLPLRRDRVRSESRACAAGSARV